MKHIVVFITILLALAVSSAPFQCERGNSAQHSTSELANINEEVIQGAVTNLQERPSVTTGMSSKVVTASSHKHSRRDKKPEEEYIHQHSKHSAEGSHRPPHYSVGHRHSRKNRYEEQLESGYDGGKRYYGDRHSHHKKHKHHHTVIGHTLENKPSENKNKETNNQPSQGNQNKAAVKPPTQNNWQGLYPAPGLGYSPYGAFPYNRYPFLSPVPIMYQPKAVQSPQHPVAPGTSIPGGIYPAQNMRQLEDTYSKLGEALRQFQDAQNLNDAQHVTYIVPYIRRLEHLYAMVYNQLKPLGYSLPYSPIMGMYTQEPFLNQLNRIYPVTDPLGLFSYASQLGNWDTKYLDLVQQLLAVEPPPFRTVPQLYRDPIMGGVLKHNFLNRLTALLDQYHYSTQIHHILPVDTNQHSLRPVLTVHQPQDIHYYLHNTDSLPAIEDTPQNRDSGPVEIHYHLTPKEDTHSTSGRDERYHLYLPEETGVAFKKQRVSNDDRGAIKQFLKQLTKKENEIKPYSHKVI